MSKRRIYTRADLEREDYQPRFAQWLRFTSGGTTVDYMFWVHDQVDAYKAATGAKRIVDQDDFTAWIEREHSKRDAA